MRIFLTLLGLSEATKNCLEPSDPTGKKYHGSISISSVGNSCRRWGRKAPSHYKNYCRKLRKREKPGCWVKVDGRRRFEYCDIPICKTAEDFVTICSPIESKPHKCGHGIKPVVFKANSAHLPFSSQYPNGTVAMHCSHTSKLKRIRKSFSRKPRQANSTKEQLDWEQLLEDRGYLPDYYYYDFDRSAMSSVIPMKTFSSSKIKIPGKTEELRIVNGEEAKIESFPWQIALREKRGSRGVFCGGVILNKNWIMTAAHCVFDLDSSEEIFVTAGHSKASYRAAKKEPSFSELNISNIFIHRKWDANEVVGDLALLKLNSSIAFLDETPLRKICLPEGGFTIDQSLPSESEEHGPVCLITGWGDTQGTTKQNVLRQASLPLITNKECNKRLWENAIPDHLNLCAGYIEGGIDSCQGDSGGPLVCLVDNAWTVVGITSWGNGCAQGPGVYTRITEYKRWILAIMKKCEDYSQGSNVEICKNLSKFILS